MTIDPLPRIGEGMFFQPRPTAADEQDEGGEQPSATAVVGTASSASSSSTTPSDAAGKTAPRKPARTTARH